MQRMYRKDTGEQKVGSPSKRCWWLSISGRDEEKSTYLRYVLASQKNWKRENLEESMPWTQTLESKVRRS